MDSRRKKACAAVLAAIAAHHLSTLQSILMIVSLSAATTSDKNYQKPLGRNKRHGAIPAPWQSIWMRVDDVNRSDERN